jgi:hypothetical protein
VGTTAPAGIMVAGALQSGFSAGSSVGQREEKPRDSGVSFELSIDPDGRENPAGSLDIGGSLC